MPTVAIVIGIALIILLTQWGVTRKAVTYVLENERSWRTEVAEWVKSSAAVAAGVALTVLYPTAVTMRTVDQMVLSPESIYDPIYLFVAGVLSMFTVVVVERHAMASVMSEKFKSMLMKYVSDNADDDDEDDQAADSAADTQVREIPRE